MQPASSLPRPGGPGGGTDHGSRRRIAFDDEAAGSALHRGGDESTSRQAQINEPPKGGRDRPRTLDRGDVDSDEDTGRAAPRSGRRRAKTLDEGDLEHRFEDDGTNPSSFLVGYNCIVAVSTACLFKIEHVTDGNPKSWSDQISFVLDCGRTKNGQILPNVRKRSSLDFIEHTQQNPSGFDPLHIPLYQVRNHNDNEICFAPRRGSVRAPVSLPGGGSAIKNAWIEFSVMAISLSGETEGRPAVISKRLNAHQRPRLLAFAENVSKCEFEPSSFGSYDTEESSDLDASPRDFTGGRTPCAKQLPSQR